jgi:predicted glycoside hydrolase/deacetylase ChbG (UPF0249 family)
MSRNGTRSLVINADDFGLHRSMNEAVERSHREGILTSASLVAAGEEFQDAVSVAKRNPRLGVGLHLTLNGEKPVCHAASIGSLVGADGKLLESHSRLCMSILNGKAVKEHLAKECEAQLVKFLDSGLTPTHLDSHRHIHLFPPLLDILMPILEKHKIKKMRWLNIPLSDYDLDLAKIGISLMLRYANLSKGRRYSHPDYFVGFFRSGHIDRQYVMTALKKLAPGVTEINS